MDTQTQQSTLTPDEAKAALGLGNQFLQGLMPQGGQPMEQEQSMDTPQTPETALGQQEAPQSEETPAQPDIEGMMAKMELSITKQLDSMRKEITEGTQKEIEEIKQDIKAALDDDEEETKTQKAS